MNPQEVQRIKKEYRRIVYVDIDNTICISDNDPKTYSTSTPLKKRIERINKLVDEGDYIVYWTARGSYSGIDWTEFTHKQLKSWGVKYHKLILFKPYYDFFIDDRNIHSENYFKDGLGIGHKV